MLQKQCKYIQNYKFVKTHIYSNEKYDILGADIKKFCYNNSSNIGTNHVWRNLTKELNQELARIVFCRKKTHTPVRWPI